MNGTITTTRFEEAALLRTSGFRFAGGEIDGSRVALRFEDRNGAAKNLLAKHNIKGVQVNSQELLDSLRWCKDRIFSIRRQAGLR